jgi:hypothetical protein
MLCSILSFQLQSARRQHESAPLPAEVVLPRKHFVWKLLLFLVNMSIEVMLGSSLFVQRSLTVGTFVFGVGGYHWNNWTALTLGSYSWQS